MNITIDSHQIFPNLKTNEITSKICFSDNPQTGLFLKENPHLINIGYLNFNKNKWVSNFLLENNLDKDKKICIPLEYWFGIPMEHWK